METTDKLAIIMEAWQQILEDAIANYRIPPQPQRVKFVLPFIAGLVLSIFSFSVEIKQIQQDGKILSHPEAPDQSPPP